MTGYMIHIHCVHIQPCTVCEMSHTFDCNCVCVPIQLDVAESHTERDRAVQEKDTAVQEKDNAVQEKERAVREKDRAVQEKRRAVREKERAVQEKEEAIHRLQVHPSYADTHCALKYQVCTRYFYPCAGDSD